MTNERQNRKLSNVRLTRSFHWRYMGLWIVISVSLCIVFSIICYQLIEEPSARLYTLNQVELEQYLHRRQAFFVGSIIEAIVLIAGVVSLAIFTAHRVAGPYIRLCAAFESVTNGNLDTRLKFRDYDHLTDVENAFNAMMESLRSHRKSSA